GNQVQGNYVGTNVAGTAAVGNGNNGVNIDGSSNNAIGGAVAGAGNLISANASSGVRICADPSQPCATPATGNVVQGNLIGLNASGTAPLGNGAGSTGNGVHIDRADNNI